MKNIMILLLGLAAANLAAQAQILDKLGKKVERKVNQRIDRKTDRAIDKGLDKVEGTADSKTASVKKEGSAKGQDEPFSASSKFDFIPGEKILFYDNFEVDAKGDFPARWNTTGSGEVVNIPKLEGKWLKVPDNTLSFPEIKNPLPENFTIEFDLYYPAGVSRPPATFGFTEVKDPARESIRYKKLFYFRISQSVDENIGYSTSIYSGREVTHGWPANKMAGKNIHVSIAVNKQRIRLYMNEEKLFDLPKAFDVNSLRNNFHFRSAVMVPAPKEGFYVSNLRIAASVADARSQLLKDGKYSTTGIYFNTGSAVIKPASHGVLMEIANVLKENPDMNINIIGHTDSDGNEASNIKLSKQRAEAVRTYLCDSFAINSKRIKTDGKGASQPVGSNQMAEGKAQNRRVEFVIIK
jgi:OOP family OmpA-OmpF porin